MYWDFVEAVRRRWIVVAGVTALVMAAVVIWTWSSPRLYLGRSSLVFDGFQSDPTAEDGGQAQLGGAFLGTQADVIASDLVAQQVIKRSGLDTQPAVVEQWRRSSDDRVSLHEWLGKRILGGLSVMPGKASNVLAVEYRAGDPDYASQMANAFADAYVATQLLLKIQPAKVYTEWFAQRTADVRQRLEEAQERMTRYQRANGLVGGAKLDVETAHLAELSTALAGAEGQSADMAAKSGGNAAMLPEVQGSAVVAGLKSTIATRSAALRQMQTAYGPQHPDILSTQAELATLRTRLAEATGQAAASIRTASAAASGHEAALRQRVAQQRARVLAMSGLQDELSVLQRDVDSAQIAYDTVTKRLNNVRLQSELPRTSASVLDHSSPSYMPVSPNVPLRAVLALAFGVMAGITIVLALEFWRPRVRTDAGLHQLLGVPRLASVSSPRRAAPRRHLADRALGRLWS